jgi:RNA recognition motif-containing protein
LYVGNLPFSVDEAALEELFSRAGAVESVRVMRDMETGRARGFAFVEMASEQDAEKAAGQFNQYQLDGRALTVNEARPQVDRRPPGGQRREPRW